MRKLKWDSCFWGFDIFHLDVNNDSNVKLSSDNNYIIQSLCDVSDNGSINILEREGFSFKESKITLNKTKMDILKTNNIKFQKLSVADLTPYKDIFFELFGRNSRFNIFPEEKVNEFYYTWLINSIDGKMDDSCIGYFKGNKLAGFVTYRIRESEIVIGLLGVLPEFQAQGVSQILLNYIDDVGVNNSLKTLSVSTQGTNIHALNAYIKNGYRIHSIKHWYYYIKGEIK